MMKRVKRGFKRFKYDLMRSLSLTRRSHGEYFITIFVFVGIALFAFLHTLISMMVTNVEYKQTGYFDLYLEKTTICWRNESLSSESSFTNDWKTNLQSINCQDPHHTLSTLLRSINNNDSSSVYAVDEDSIRKPLRRIFSGNCSSLAILHHSSTVHKQQQQQLKAHHLMSSQLFDAGSCFEYHDSSSSSSLTSFFPLSLSSVSSPSTSSPFSNKLYRCLPSFLIIGAMKSGTGELMKWLNLHPFLRVGNGLQYEENLASSSHSKDDVEDINAELNKLNSISSSSSSQENPSKEEKKKLKQKEEMRKEVLSTNQKEVHFFSKYLYHLHHKHLLSSSSSSPSSPTSSSSSSFSLSSYIASLSPSQKYHILQQYLPYFPTFSGNSDDLSTLYTFEKSPDYIRNKLILNLIYSLFPSMKVIIQLRNPSTRAVSEFHHNCRKNRYIKLISNLYLPGIMGNRSYIKGNVLKNNDKLKDYHSHLPGEDGMYDSGSNPSSFTSRHSSSHQLLDRFTVNAKELPINSYITLPYPCSVNDMMTYFTQFDSSYSSSSSSSASSSSSSSSSKQLSKKSIRLRRKLLETTNSSTFLAMKVKEEPKKNTASSTTTSHPLQKIKDSHSRRNDSVFPKVEESRTTVKPSTVPIQKLAGHRTPQSIATPVPPLSSQSVPGMSMKNHSRLHHQHSHLTSNSSDGSRPLLHQTSSDNSKASKITSGKTSDVDKGAMLPPRKHPFTNLPVSSSMLATYPKEIINGFYFNQINNILKM
jgi:hypothetical protein